MKNKKCIVCNNANIHARGICKACYNYAFRWGKHKLPNNEMYEFIRTNRMIHIPIYKDSNNTVENLPDINLDECEVKHTSRYQACRNIILDFLSKFR